MTRSLKPSRFSLRQLPAIALMTGFLSLSLIQPVLSQERMLRALTVTGRGKETIETTLAVVRLGVEAQGKTAKEVQAEVSRRSNAVISLLKARGVQKLETTGVNLSPNYRYDNGKQTLLGYSGSNIVSFRTSIAEAGRIIDDSVQAGASRIDGVNFIASDEAISAAQKLALRKATQDAQAQADAVFDALNLNRKEVVSVQVNGAFVPPPQPVNFQRSTKLAGEAVLDAAALPIQGGDQDVEASVTLQISY